MMLDNQIETQELPQCYGCGLPLRRRNEQIIGTCTDCVQASQARDRQRREARVTQPGYGWQKQVS